MRSILFILSLVLFSCGPGPESSSLRFDAEHSIELDAWIDDGAISTNASDPKEQEKLIRRQLKYSVGQLNGIGAAPSLERISVQILPAAARAEEVHYRAQLKISWPRERRIPASISLYLPRLSEESFIARFLGDFESGKRCLKNDAHDVDRDNSWYFYRPERLTCEITAYPDPEVAIIPVRLGISADNSEGQFPEYGKIWEDGRLVITAIFGKYEEDAADFGDVGMASYRNFYRALVQAFGSPISTSLPLDRKEPLPSDSFIDLTFASDKGPIDLHMELIAKVGSEADEDFEARYQHWTQYSDYISYNGHSGLGANIRRLVKLGKFVKGQYQIVLLNGCDTYSYVNDALRSAHQAVNPEEGADKYVDILLNTMPSYFNQSAKGNMAMIQGLIRSEDTYRQILARFDPYQRVLVTGEGDNAPWPPVLHE